MTGIVILAAGESARMGQPKQKLLYHGKSLLQHAVQAALNSTCRPVIVVLGAYADIVLADIKGEPVVVIHNSNWEEGMASSIRVGIMELEKDDDITGAIIMLCDQPFVDAALIDSLIAQKEKTGKGIVACYYGDTVGVPVLFDRKYFAELLLLKGHDGAKKLLHSFKKDVITIPFALGKVDIDTIKDYENLL
ncbi:nucleotidyltransferase family protein [uncultured Mucilaginibacter sp.]|uniref:nucleotidyltransferase family protein n=1 Tax=uncultured Mucilaginibacter sp. TaxID=797541 RepID=UPI0025CD8BBB|nr:nucleotidyltransferase family protein [uncultured Mucilaginibacter sp.]